MTRAHYKIKLCQDQVFSVEELCLIDNVRRNAVTDWIKSGLQKSDEQVPCVFRGAELQRYHSGQKRKQRAKLKQGEFNCLSNSTIRHHASQVRQIFEWLRIPDGYKRLSQNILLNLELPKAVRTKTLPREDQDYLTIEEAEEMLTKMPVRTIEERRDRAIITCAYTWGLRAAALTTLQLNHIDMQK